MYAYTYVCIILEFSYVCIYLLVVLLHYRRASHLMHLHKSILASSILVIGEAF